MVDEPHGLDPLPSPTIDDPKDLLHAVGDRGDGSGRGERWIQRALVVTKASRHAGPDRKQHPSGFPCPKVRPFPLGELHDLVVEASAKPVVRAEHDHARSRRPFRLRRAHPP